MKPDASAPESMGEMPLLSEALERGILELAHAVLQGAVLKESTYADLQAAFELLTKAVRGEKSEERMSATTATSQHVAETVHDLIAPPLIEEDVISPQEREAWDAMALQAEEAISHALTAVSELPKKEGLPDHPCEPSNLRRLTDATVQLHNGSSLIMAGLRGAEIENGGKTQREQFRIALLDQITKAYDIVCTLRGLRGEERINNGTMEELRAQAAVRNLCRAVNALQEIAQKLDADALQNTKMAAMLDELDRVFRALRSAEQRDARRSVRAEDFTGGFNQRRKKA